MREFLLASDFDQTLSVNDSGHGLSEMLGIPEFATQIERLLRIHLLPPGDSDLTPVARRKMLADVEVHPDDR